MKSMAPCFDMAYKGSKIRASFCLEGRMNDQIKLL